MTSPLSQVLIRLCGAIGSANTLDDLYTAALNAVQDATGIRRAAILLFDADGVMRFKASSGISTEYRRAVEGHTPWAMGTPAPEPIVVADGAADAALTTFRSVFARERIASLAFVPIVSRGEVIGKSMVYDEAARAFEAGEIPAALAIGYQIGFAVERARTMREEGITRERLTVLTEASRRLLTSLHVEAVVHEIIALAGRTIAADAYAVWRRDHSAWRIAASRHLSPEFAAQVLQDNSRVPFDSPIVAEDAVNMVVLDGRKAAYEREGIRSLVSIPLEERGGPIGSIAFYYRNVHRPSDMEVRVAVALGHLAAAAMSNARLFTEAQEANRLKDEFLATLSHELRTPLNVILGRIRMMGSGPTAAAAVPQTVETIERNGQLLARLVDDLLDSSRITLGTVRLDLQPVHVASLVDTVVASVEPTARTRGVTLEVKPHAAPEALLVDATRLQQVLWNLLSNAIKFTPTGGRVTVSLRRDAAHVLLGVSDTGQGIDPEFLPHVFDMFRQAEPAKTRHYGGLGLGLSIVRRLVELHGGHVEARSDGAGKGTTVLVYLPVPGTSHAGSLSTSATVQP